MSFVILTVLAMIYLSQLVRVGRMSMQTKGMVGSNLVNAISYFMAVPIFVPALNIEMVPEMNGVILWFREYVVQVAFVIVITNEVFVRAAISRGISRVSNIAETSDDIDELFKAIGALEVLGMADQAIASLQRIVELDDTVGKTYAHLASLYGMQRQFQLAYEMSKKAVVLEPENPLSHYYYAMACYELGHFQEAKEGFKKAECLGKYVSPDTMHSIERRIEDSSS